MSPTPPSLVFRGLKRRSVQLPSLLAPLTSLLFLGCPELVKPDPVPKDFAESITDLTLGGGADGGVWTASFTYRDLDESSSSIPYRLSSISDAVGTLDAHGNAYLKGPNADAGSDFDSMFEIFLNCPNPRCSNGTLRLEKKTGDLAGVAYASVERFSPKFVARTTVLGTSKFEPLRVINEALRSHDPMTATVSTLEVMGGGRHFYAIDLAFKSALQPTSTDWYDSLTARLSGTLTANGSIAAEFERREGLHVESGGMSIQGSAEQERGSRVLRLDFSTDHSTDEAQGLVGLQFEKE